MTWKPSPTPSAVNNKVLVVSGNDEDLRRLRGAFDRSSWQLHTARTVDQAKAKLREEAIGVVLCSCHLLDGDWKTLLEFEGGLPHPPKLVVLCHHADDRLWAEVLNLGGFDVLDIPASPPDLFRAIGSAWRNWRESLEEYGAAQVSRAHSL